MHALETLDLSGNEITADAMDALSACLEAHTGLKQLMLDDNELETEGAKALADALDNEAMAPALEGTYAIDVSSAAAAVAAAARTHAKVLPPLVPTLAAFSDDGPLR